MDANQPALWPGSSYPPFGIESSPLRVPQEECWPTSSTMLGDDDRFQYFDRLQEDPSSFYSSSRFCLPDMPSFDTLEAISQWHPTRVSPSNFQPAASSRATIAPSLMMGCFGHDHATFVNNDVKSDDQDALTRNASIDKKKKHVYGDPNVVKGQWTAQEDRLLSMLVEQHGLKKWSQIAQFLKGRVGKQCRERWHNHLRPNIKKDKWTKEEDMVLIRAHSEIGNKWAEIAKRLPGRAENCVKNHWNATKRCLLSRRRCTSPKPPTARSCSSTLLLGYMNSLFAPPPQTNPLSTPILPPLETCAADDSGCAKEWLENEFYASSEDMAFFKNDPWASRILQSYLEDAGVHGKHEV